MALATPNSCRLTACALGSVQQALNEVAIELEHPFGLGANHRTQRHTYLNGG